MDREEALDVVGRRRYEEFVGVFESDQLEFKSAPYQLDTRKGPFELAKDISGLANHRGGAIVVGISTRREPVSRRDIGERLSLFSEQLVDVPRLNEVVAAKVYPDVEGLSVEWFASADDGARGVLLIDVPPQREERKYFLVSHPLAEDEPVAGYLVGLARRRGENVLPDGIQDIYRLIRDGRNIFSRLAAIEVQLGRLEPIDRVAEPVPEPEPIPPVQQTLEEFS